MTSAFSWSGPARDLLYDILRFWAENGRGPNLKDLHLMTGGTRGTIRQLLLELQAGFGLAFADDRLQLNITKAPPFSAVPTPVSAFVDDRFHTYLGCAAEALTVGNLPMFQDRQLSIRTYCACCYAAMSLDVRGIEVLGSSPASPVVVIAGSPWDWGPGVPCDRVCDAFHFVLDNAHADRFQQQIGRRSVVASLGQMRMVSAGTAARRMHADDFGPIRRSPVDFIEHVGACGVDVDVWRATDH